MDCVEAGTVQWKTVVRNFYPDLKHDVDEAEKELEKVDIQDEVTDVICDNCGRNMVIKYGPHGRFLACPGFPDCRNTKPYGRNLLQRNVRNVVIICSKREISWFAARKPADMWNKNQKMKID